MLHVHVTFKNDWLFVKNVLEKTTVNLAPAALCPHLRELVHVFTHAFAAVVARGPNTRSKLYLISHEREWANRSTR